MPAAGSSGAAPKVTSIGHGSGIGAPTPRAIAKPGTARRLGDDTSETGGPAGTAPGCHEAPALESAVPPAPAWPRPAVVEPTTGGGTGAGATRPVDTELAELDPPVPVALPPSEDLQPTAPPGH